MQATRSARLTGREEFGLFAQVEGFTNIVAFLALLHVGLEVCPESMASKNAAQSALRAYMADTDAFVVDSGHAVPVFRSRFDRYANAAASITRSINAQSDLIAQTDALIQNRAALLQPAGVPS